MIVVREGESVEDAIRRFKREVSRNGTLNECKKHEYASKPGVKRREKQKLARQARQGKKKR